MTLDDHLSLTANIAATAGSCRCMLHNIRRIRPLLTQKAAQVLVQALVQVSRLGLLVKVLVLVLVSGAVCQVLVQVLVKVLVQNAGQLDRAGLQLLPKCSPTLHLLLRSLHWLPVAARIRFKTLVLAFHAKKRIRSTLHPGHDQNLHPSPPTSLCIGKPARCPLTERIAEAFAELETVHCPRSQMVERAPHRHPDSGKPPHLPPPTKNTFL